MFQSPKVGSKIDAASINLFYFGNILIFPTDGCLDDMVSGQMWTAGLQTSDGRIVWNTTGEPINKDIIEWDATDQQYEVLDSSYAVDFRYDKRGHWRRSLASSEQHFLCEL